MKITTFNPQVVTQDSENVKKFFEELGFTERHNPQDMGLLNVKAIRMKDENGFHLDISEGNVLIPNDIVAIRMNVDDFDEAYQILIRHGFTNIYGDGFMETPSSKSAMMISPTGFAINLIHHKRKHD